MDWPTLIKLMVTAAAIILIIIVSKSIIDGSAGRIFDIGQETQKEDSIPYSAIDTTCELCPELVDGSPRYLPT